MVDVLISVYNGEKFLSQAIESLLKQTLVNFNVLIIDDASSDRSVKIIRQYNDKRIHYFQNKTRCGLTANLNFLLTKSMAVYVARLDADDVSIPDRLEKELMFLERNHFDLVGCFTDLIDEKGLIVGEKIYTGQNFKNDLLKFNPFPHSSWFARRQVFKALNGFNEKYYYAQDYDFLLRAVELFKIGVVPEKLIKMRILKSSVSLKNLKKQQLYSLKARVSALKRGQYSLWRIIFLVPPLLSYLLPENINKIIYRLFYGYKNT